MPVTEQEAAVIEAQAQATGLSIAAYLRNVGTGYQPRAMVDHDEVQQMLRVNGDLGRLGGLLKLFLTNDDKLARFPKGQVQAAVEGALAEIEATQSELRQVVRRALRSTS